MIWLSLLLILGSFSFVHADIIVQQTTHDTAATSSLSGGFVLQTLGTNLSGLVGSYAIYASGLSGNTSIPINLYECPTATYGTSLGNLSGCTNLDSGGAAVTVSATPAWAIRDGVAVALVSSKYYTLVFGNGAGLFYGSGTDTYPAGSCVPGSHPCEGVSDLAFYVNGATTVPLHSQVYSIITPTEFQVTGSSNVTVSYQYIDTGDYDTAAVLLIDQTNNKLTLVTGSLPAQTSAIATYSNIFTLIDNHAYRVQGVLLNASGSSTPLYGPFVDFSTLSDQYFSASSTLFNLTTINEQNASSSINESSGVFSGLPNFFANRVPFCYAWQIRDIYRNAATSSSVYGGISLDWQSLAISSTSREFLPNRTDLFSTTTVGHYLNGSLLDSFNALASAAIAAGTLYVIYKKALSLGFNI